MTGTYICQYLTNEGKICGHLAIGKKDVLFIGKGVNASPV